VANGRTVYYRVRTTASTGATSFSNIAKLNPSTAAMSATITRVPNQVKVTLENSIKGKATIRVVDAAGSLLSQQTVYPNHPSQLVTIDLPASVNGKPVIVSVYNEQGLIRTQKLL
jgi:hypothetical protein